MVVCVLVPRFELLSAVSDRELLLRPAALAPEPGREQAVGEVSGAAEGYGIHPGMRLGEALARCPELILVTPDPDRTESAWDHVLSRLEGMGAAVESERPGEAFFEEEGLRGLWGGRAEDVLARARRAVEVPARLGAGPTRFCAYAVAKLARPRGRRRSGSRRAARRPRPDDAIVPPARARSFLAPLPVGLLRRRLGEGSRLPATVERLGIRTLGEVAALDRGAVADRFGPEGLTAWSLARGEDSRLRPRPFRERLAEGLDLPEAVSGQQLDRALAMLVDRLLANRGRRGRTLRRLRLAARLAGGGGGWRAEVPLREASASSERLLLALAPKLEQIPGPATWIELAALELGPPAHGQQTLTRDAHERRRARLAEAVRQARAAAGRDAVLRVLAVDPGSRVPERRATLTPFPEPQ